MGAEGLGERGLFGRCSKETGIIRTERLFGGANTE